MDSLAAVPGEGEGGEEGRGSRPLWWVPLDAWKQRDGLFLCGAALLVCCGVKLCDLLLLIPTTDRLLGFQSRGCFHLHLHPACGTPSFYLTPPTSSFTLLPRSQDSEFPSLSGARIVRIAVHPDLARAGYGSRAVQLLTR